MRPRPMLLCLAIYFLCHGCSSLLVKSAPVPRHYQLDYKPVRIDCPNRYDQPVKVYPLESASPYDQTDMVVAEKQHQVKYSATYQWVSPPGSLIADSLLRDLSGATLFPEAVGADSSQFAPLALTGRVFAFLWKNTESGYRASLQAEMSLRATGAKRHLLMHKIYSLTSEPYRQNNADNFARAMSATMAAFSRRLQEDLCSAR